MNAKTEYLKIAQAARLKNVQRGSVYHALAMGTIDGEKIAGTVMVVDNNKFRQWTPGRK